MVTGLDPATTTSGRSARRVVDGNEAPHGEQGRQCEGSGEGITSVKPPNSQLIVLSNQAGVKGLASSSRVWAPAGVRENPRNGGTLERIIAP